MKPIKTILEGDSHEVEAAYLICLLWACNYCNFDLNPPVLPHLDIYFILFILRVLHIHVLCFLK
jgi:hypothetical protein